MRTIPSSGCTLYTIIRGEMMSLTTWKWQVVSLIPWIARPWRGSKSPILRVRSSWTGEMKWEAFELRECNTGGGEEILNILPGWRSPWLFFNNTEGEWNTCRWSTGGWRWRGEKAFIFAKIWFQSICELWIGREIDVPVFSQVEKEEDHLQESESGKSL